MNISCLNFWDKAWWFFSLRVFGLLSSFLWLFPQRFGQYVLWPSSGVCRTWEPTQNFEQCPLLNSRGSLVLIALAITRFKSWVFLYCYSPAVRSEPATSRWLTESEQVTSHGFSKGHSLKFRESSRVRQTPEEGQRTYWLKCGNNNKDEDNSPKTLNDKTLMDLKNIILIKNI